ncbi:hypothetical protein FH972_024494 [Carpinus fangiana]|uniref:NACHT domain-containing protein n=1 Tax=Carpinus fangiana TaxID=176857 RepID=A0A5N6KYK2_9ROSI|nr:hypothetical protein FH972_024494 [Carpinus fangiana]
MYTRQTNIGMERGTCEWLPKHPRYCRWHSQDQGILWILGNPGAGKSTVMKFISQHARSKNLEDSDLILSFFFNDRGVPLERETSGLLRTLLHQLLSEETDPMTETSKIFQKRCTSQGFCGKDWGWTEKELRELLESTILMVPLTRKVLIFIDGLDEAGETAARSLVRYFRRLSEKSAASGAKLCICFASRPYPIVGHRSDEESTIVVHQENTLDIQTYLRNELQPSQIGEALALRLQKLISEAANGMFQWVSSVTTLALERYFNGDDEVTITKVITNLPGELAHSYRNILRMTTDEDLDQCFKLFQWVCFCLRPLSFAELRYVLALEDHLLCLSGSGCVSGPCFSKDEDQAKKKLTNLSKGLIELSVGSNGNPAQHKTLVRFVHPSVKEYILKGGLNDIQPLGLASVIGQAHFQLSSFCLRFIALHECEIAQEDYAKLMKDGSDLLEYSSKYWFIHAEKAKQEGVYRGDLNDILTEETVTRLIAIGAIVKPWSMTWFKYRSIVFNILKASGMTRNFDSQLPRPGKLVKESDNLEKKPLSRSITVVISLLSLIV